MRRLAASWVGTSCWASGALGAGAKWRGESTAACEVPRDAESESSASGDLLARSTWEQEMVKRYGEGAYKLFRPLYKDMCDEVRREYYTKPPAPMEGWTVTHDEQINQAVFRRPADEKRRMGNVVAFVPIAMANPPRMNDLLLFVDWYAIEVLIERNDVIMHVSLAAFEGGMHMRNIRMYRRTDCPSLIECCDDSEWVRQNLFYDGPCLWHLELDFQNELYDVMQDHGVNLNWARWVAEWVYYLEHVQYLRWSIGVQEHLIPSALRGPEEHFLTAAEREALEESTEDWLDPHHL